MTGDAGGIFHSGASNRPVVPGWHHILPDVPDSIELQLNLDPRDLARGQALLLIEFWATPEELTLQSLLPVRSFRADEPGWCVFLPARGRVFIRAIDPQPSPPVLAAHGIRLHEDTPFGTTVHVDVNFPGTEATHNPPPPGTASA